MPTAAGQVSQELWDMIVEYQSALPARYAATAFGFRLRPQQERLAGIWGAIFQDMRWISTVSSNGCGPILIGKSLDRWSSDSVSQREKPYLVLLAKPFESIIERDLFLHSLSGPRTLNDVRELELTSGVTLNVAHLYGSLDRLPVRIPELVDQYKRPRTAVLFWQGRSIASVNLETIVDAKGRGSERGSVLKTFVGYRVALEYFDGTRI